ncbi:MAG: hypothetical protein QXR42_07340 [Candidatus Bathyarchaeia archaeon]
MNKKMAIILTLVLIASLLMLMIVECIFDYTASSPKIFVGVEFLYNGDVNTYEEIIKKVKGYTNMVVVGLSKKMEVTTNETLLNQVCDYIYKEGFYFIVQLTAIIKFSYNITDWVVTAKNRYGDRLLGVYYFDEPGGRQLDDESLRLVPKADNWTEASEKYVHLLYVHIEPYLRTNVKLLTADYGLYWFNYLAKYDTLLVEFGWNHSRQLQISLCRGAANIQGKEWGVIITWTYTNPPYLEPANNLYSDLVLAYHSGAKYAIIFEYEIMQEEHFKALERFWSYVNTFPERHGIIKSKVAYVLPKDYGFGFRKQNDTIWGLWTEKSDNKIWNDVNRLVYKYDGSLDIVYEDPDFIHLIKEKYSIRFFWNQTVP